MPLGRSLHIGVNEVDPAHYQGWRGELAACEADARDLEAVARAQGLETTLLLTRDVTRDAVLAALDAAAADLRDGDLFWVSYAGHGGQLPDRDRDEADALDETWCLFDGQLLDDELYARYAAFRAGVRILITSDSCHSGTVSRLDATEVRAREMPKEVAVATFRGNRDFYDRLTKGRRGTATRAAELKASLLLLSGCQDNQLSADGAENGLFTGTLLRVWADGAFQGDYRQLHREVLHRMPANQTPNLDVQGPAGDAFQRQRPFTVAS